VRSNSFLDGRSQLSRIEAEHEATKEEILALSRTIGSAQDSGAAWLEAHALGELAPRLAAIGVQNVDDVRALTQPKRMLLQAGLSDGQLAKLSHALEEMNNGTTQNVQPSEKFASFYIAPLPVQRSATGQEAPWSFPRAGKYGSSFDESWHGTNSQDTLPSHTMPRLANDDATILSSPHMALRLEQGRKSMKEELRKELMEQLMHTRSNPFRGTDNREAASPVRSRVRNLEPANLAPTNAWLQESVPYTSHGVQPDEQQLQDLQDLAKIDQLELNTSMRHVEAAEALKQTMDKLSEKLLEQNRIIDGMQAAKELEKQARVKAEEQVASLRDELEALQEAQAVLQAAQAEHEAWANTVSQRHEEGEKQVRRLFAFVFRGNILSLHCRHAHSFIKLLSLHRRQNRHRN
jgi:hypothetical protein